MVPLFTRFPKLQSLLPHLPLEETFPTPVGPHLADARSGKYDGKPLLCRHTKTNVPPALSQG